MHMNCQGHFKGGELGDQTGPPKPEVRSRFTSQPPDFTPPTESLTDSLTIRQLSKKLEALHFVEHGGLLHSSSSENK